MNGTFNEGQPCMVYISGLSIVNWVGTSSNCFGFEQKSVNSIYTTTSTISGSMASRIKKWGSRNGLVSIPLFSHGWHVLCFIFIFSFVRFSSFNVYSDWKCV